MEIFSILLKQERLSNQYTQKQMAELLNIPLRAYQNYEAIGKNHREPDMEMLIKIAKVLDISVDFLLGQE